MSTRPITSIDRTERLLRRLYDAGDTARLERALIGRLQVHNAKRTAELANEVLRPHGLTQVSFAVLMMLLGADDEPVNPSQACDMLGESRANMTRLCDDLVERGLVARTHAEDDRRRLLLTVTPAGERLARKMLPLLDARLAPVFDGFSASERAKLVRLLKRQLHALESL